MVQETPSYTFRIGAGWRTEQNDYSHGSKSTQAYRGLTSWIFVIFECVAQWRARARRCLVKIHPTLKLFRVRIRPGFNVSGFLEKGWYLHSKFAYEFRVAPEVYVSYVQDSYLVLTASEMCVYVLAVDWFHDDDNVGPIDKFLCQCIALWNRRDSSGLSLPITFPALKEPLGRWATLQIRRTNKENFPHG